jgi:hypothetical protein
MFAPLVDGCFTTGMMSQSVYQIGVFSVLNQCLSSDDTPGGGRPETETRES